MEKFLKFFFILFQYCLREWDFVIELTVLLERKGGKLKENGIIFLIALGQMIRIFVKP